MHIEQDSTLLMGEHTVVYVDTAVHTSRGPWRLLVTGNSALVRLCLYSKIFGRITDMSNPDPWSSNNSLLVPELYENKMNQHVSSLRRAR